MIYYTIPTDEETPLSQSLNGVIREKRWLGLGYRTLTSRFIPVESRDIIQGLTHSESVDGRWHLPHLVELAKECYEEMDNPTASYHISHYLNKKLP